MPKLTKRRPMQGRTIDFPHEVYDELEGIAEEEGRTFANLIRHIVGLWLAGRRDENKEAA